MFKHLASFIQKTNTADSPDVEYADPGYQKDSKPRYRLDDKEHIRAAWNYIHKAHNRSFYTESQLEEIERKIIEAWKKHIDPAGPPSAR